MQRDIKINLLRYKIEKEHAQSQLLKELVVFGLIFLLLAGAAAGMYLQQQKEMAGIKTDNLKLQKEVDNLRQVATMASISSKELEGIDSRRALIERLEKEPKLDPAFLEDIYIASGDIIVSKITVKNGELDINAYADSQTSCIDYIDRLKAIPRIKDVMNVNSRLNEKNGEVTFSLTLKWEVR